MSEYSWRTSPTLTQRTRTQAQYPAARPSEWTPPTGHTQAHVIVVAGERTCTGCWDTFSGEYCTRCGARDDQAGARRAVQPPSVLTTSYLRPGEWTEAR